LFFLFLFNVLFLCVCTVFCFVFLSLCCLYDALVLLSLHFNKLNWIICISMTAVQIFLIDTSMCNHISRFWTANVQKPCWMQLQNTSYFHNERDWARLQGYGESSLYFTFSQLLNTVSIVKPTRCTCVSNLFLFWNDTLHVSDGLSVHHQEFKTVHTATGICQTDTAVCKHTAVSVWHMPVAVCTVLNSWWWTERPSETCRVSFQNKIYLIHWCI